MLSVSFWAGIIHAALVVGDVVATDYPDRKPRKKKSKADTKSRDEESSKQPEPVEEPSVSNA